MDSVPIRYIGDREEHSDDLYGTGFTWKRFEVKKVPMEVAPYLLAHSDVYEDARPKKERQAQPVKPARGFFRMTMDEDPPMPRIAYMKKEALLDFAERWFGERLDGKNLTEAQIRDRILRAARTR